jgi:hypothetical protein
MDSVGILIDEGSATAKIKFLKISSPRTVSSWNASLSGIVSHRAGGNCKGRGSSFWLQGPLLMDRPSSRYRRVHVVYSLFGCFTHVGSTITSQKCFQRFGIPDCQGGSVRAKHALSKKIKRHKPDAVAFVRLHYSCDCRYRLSCWLVNRQEHIPSTTAPLQFRPADCVPTWRATMQGQVKPVLQYYSPVAVTRTQYNFLI